MDRWDSDGLSRGWAAPGFFLDSSCLGVPRPFAEGAPREMEALGLLAGAELRREGPLEPRPPRVTLGHPESRRGLQSAGRGLGPGRGRSAAPLFLGGRTSSGSQETQCQLFQAVVPGFEISFWKFIGATWRAKRLNCGFCTCLEVKIKTRLGKVLKAKGAVRNRTNSLV